jgi:hypothetical protein
MTLYTVHYLVDLEESVLSLVRQLKPRMIG